MDPLTLLAALAIGVVLVLALDLLLTGGATTCAVAGGMGSMLGTPWGWLGLLLLLGLVAALIWWLR